MAYTSEHDCDYTDINRVKQVRVTEIQCLIYQHTFKNIDFTYLNN